jgi:hypothetical protein
MMETAVVVPKFQSFSSHIFTQVSQNITVKVWDDRSVRRNKFTVNNPLHLSKIVLVRHTIWNENEDPSEDGPMRPKHVKDSKNWIIIKIHDWSHRTEPLPHSNPLHVEKNNEHALCWTPNLPHLLLLVIVGSSTAMIVAVFLDHNHTSKSNFRHPLWS